jgi:hypothetical protein
MALACPERSSLIYPLKKARPSAASQLPAEKKKTNLNRLQDPRFNQAEWGTCDILILQQAFSTSFGLQMNILKSNDALDRTNARELTFLIASSMLASSWALITCIKRVT